MKNKKVIISVTSDLVTDQRVHKTAQVLHNEGFDVTLIGRKLKSSAEMPKRDYKVVRMSLPFEKGPQFYASYNFYLFLYLLFHKANILHSNDLDTLLANYLVSKIKKTNLVYDSHEYFTGVPEIQNRKFVKWAWTSIEKFIFPKLKHVYTVNESIANIYQQLYNVNVGVVRNVPFLYKIDNQNNSLPFDASYPFLIFQGAALNVDRGAEEAILSMQWIENVKLLIIGGGDVIGNLHQIVKDYKLEDKVYFLPKMPHEQLKSYTSKAILGLSFDKSSNENYKYSLPNKVFDYLHAGIPVLASEVIEVARVIKKYKVGDFIPNHEPKAIADKINEILANQEQLSTWKNNTFLASQECNWQKESDLIVEIYKKL